MLSDICCISIIRCVVISFTFRVENESGPESASYLRDQVQETCCYKSSVLILYFSAQRIHAKFIYGITAKWEENDCCSCSHASYICVHMNLSLRKNGIELKNFVTETCSLCHELVATLCIKILDLPSVDPSWLKFGSPKASFALFSRKGY